MVIPAGCGSKQKMCCINHCSLFLFIKAMVTTLPYGRGIWYFLSTPAILGCSWSREFLGFFRHEEELYINYTAVRNT